MIWPEIVEQRKKNLQCNTIPYLRSVFLFQMIVQVKAYYEYYFMTHVYCASCAVARFLLVSPSTDGILVLTAFSKNSYAPVYTAA